MVKGQGKILAEKKKISNLVLICFPWGLLGQGLKSGLEIYKNKKSS
jgi:hypothetical protein